MKNTKRLFLITIFLSGCATVSLFKDLRDYDIGRSVELAYLPPADKILPYSESSDKYLFKGNGECEFSYIVNKQTKIVESWEYISSPEKCKTGLNWLGQW